MIGHCTPQYSWVYPLEKMVKCLSIAFNQYKTYVSDRLQHQIAFKIILWFKNCLFQHVYPKYIYKTVTFQVFKCSSFLNISRERATVTINSITAAASVTFFYKNNRYKFFLFYQFSSFWALKTVYFGFSIRKRKKKSQRVVSCKF